MRVGLSCFGGTPGQTGGIQVYRRELLRALATHDAANDYVLLFLPGDEISDVPMSSRFTAIRLSWPGGRPPRAWVQRARLVLHSVGPPFVSDPLSPQIDSLGLDVVHYPATRIGELALRTPVVLTFFDMQEEFLPDSFPRRERLARRLAHRSGVRRADVVLAPSEFTAEALERIYGVPPSKVRRVGVGVGPQYCSTGLTDEGQPVRTRYRLPPEFLLYPANPWPHKNHARLFAALRRLKAQCVRVPPLVCTGRLAREVRSAADLAREAGLGTEDVLDLGFVSAEDMPSLYRAARMMVFPSLFEGYGMPVLEALACGCPVACARAASLPELGGNAVRYFDPRSEKEIGAAIEAVAFDEAARGEQVRRGLGRAEQYRWDRIVPALVRAYHEAAALSRR
jgi:glycosyltransferase involved in cell wall biosynthesis